MELGGYDDVPLVPDLRPCRDRNKALFVQDWALPVPAAALPISADSRSQFFQRDCGGIMGLRDARTKACSDAAIPLTQMH